MALNFPDSPTNGQLYTDPVNGNRYTYDSANSAWKSTSTFQYNATVSSTAPGTPQQGSLWWNQDYGRLLVYYQDANTSQWVDATPSMDYRSDIFAVANAGFGKANTALQNTTGTFEGSLYTTGKIGIGTNSIASNQILKVWGGRSGLVANSEPYALGVSHSTVSGNDYCYIGATSGATPSMVFSNAGGAELMRIDSSGRIGIATSSPASPLNIITPCPVDSSGAVGKWGIRVNDSTSMTTGVGGSILFQGDKGTGTGNFGGIAGLKENSTSGNESGYLAFYTTPNSTQFITERMRLNSLGHLTVSNQPKFWVNGSPGITATTTPQKFPWTGPATYDSAGGFSDANDRYTAPVTGYYYIYTKLNIQTSTQTTYMMIYKNGSQYSNGWIVNNQRQDYWVNHIIPLNASDYVEIWVSTAAGTTGFDNSGYFGGYLLG